MNDHRHKLRGLIFYKYEDGNEHPTTLRLTGYKESTDEYAFIRNGNYTDTLRLPAKDGLEGWVRLNPDGIMRVANVTSVTNQGEEVPDVMVTIHKYNGESGELLPPLVVCRQSVIDIFALMQSNKTLVGLSISEKTCPPETSFASFYQQKSTTLENFAAVYMDDKLPNIVKLINMKKHDQMLRLIHQRSKMQVEGYYDTVYELLKFNDFMVDFYAIFDVYDIPFLSPDIDKDLRTVEVNKALTEFIISEKLEVPTKFYPVKYSKEIDLREIKRNYILVAPHPRRYPYADIIILAYDVSAEISYKDYINKGMSAKRAKREIMQQLGWK